MSEQTALFKFYRGRVALFALLNAFGIGRRDRVLMPAYTGSAVPRAVEYTGAVPEYADIDPQSYNSLLPHYEAAYDRLREEGRAGELAAVIVKHAYGNPNRDTEAIAEWAGNKGLLVVEDCSQVCGGALDGIPLGFFGDGAFYSTGWGRPVTTGLGGAVRVNDPGYEEVMSAVEMAAASPAWGEALLLAALLFVHNAVGKPRLRWLAARLAAKGVPERLNPDDGQGGMPSGYFRGMHVLQRRIFDSGIRKLDEKAGFCVRLAAEYDRLLEERGVSGFVYEKGAALLRYPVRVSDKAACLQSARTAGMDLAERLNTLAGREGGELNWNEKLVPNAVAAVREVVSLPLYPWMTLRDAERAADCLSGFSAGRRTQEGGNLPQRQ